LLRKRSTNSRFFTRFHRGGRHFPRQVSLDGAEAGAGPIVIDWTLGGIVGASVIATRSLPFAHGIDHSPRSGFST